MENFDLALEAGKEELALDRPPCSKKHIEYYGNELSENGISLTKKFGESDISITSTKLHSFSDDIGSNLDSNISVNNLSEKDIGFEKLNNFEYEIDKHQSSCNVNQDQPPLFDLISNNKNTVQHESLTIQSSVETAILSLPPTNNKSLEKIKKIAERKGGKNPLVSCLKSKKHEDVENGCETEIKVSNKPKKITFVEGEKIVSEYIEPYDPWLNARTPTHTEVISFYRNTCQKLRCKPLEKVIKQFQDVPDLSQRAGTLVLRGSRLDNKSCEALETIFKRVQYENLDIENCSLEEEGASALIEMIEFYRTTCKLNIACNPKIGVRGWQALCRMLRKTPCLTYLDARRTLLTDVTMACFGRCLKADPYLKVLHLEGVFLSGRSLLILTTAMKYNHILEELYIGDNDLTSSDGPPLGAMLTYNTTLQLLDIRNNPIKDIGLAHISNGLSDQADQPFGGGLCSLIIWNTGLTHEGMSYLAEGLIKTRSIKALNLGQNRIGDLGMQKLKHGLIKNKSLKKVGFLNTKIGSEGAVALAEVLADSLTLTRIDLRGNELQVAGLMAFSMALKVNQSLTKLDLDKAIKKEPGMESVIQTVLVDIYNYCHRNKQLNTSTIPFSVSLSTSESSCSLANNIVGKDIFHPEELKQPIIPFSPVQNKEDNFNEQQNNHTTTETSSDLLQNNTDSVISGSVQKPQNILNITNPNDQLSKRESRFSVTKILDTLGNHAADVANKIANNVANIDLQLKRNNSKEQFDAKSFELPNVYNSNTEHENQLSFKNTPDNCSFEVTSDKLSPEVNTDNNFSVAISNNHASEVILDNNHSEANHNSTSILQLENDNEFIYMKSSDNAFDRIDSLNLSSQVDNSLCFIEMRTSGDFSSLEEHLTLKTSGDNFFKEEHMIKKTYDDISIKQDLISKGKIMNTNIHNDDTLIKTPSILLTDTTFNDLEKTTKLQTTQGLLKTDLKDFCDELEGDSFSVTCNLDSVSSSSTSFSINFFTTEMLDNTYNLPAKGNDNENVNEAKVISDNVFALREFKCESINQSL
ncbi:uncharacterized protein LOC100213531 isoform X3 [Hydra vulgaris]|uniref:Uncharacterized protein LOC100213531 isoform X3 n=1 Tax=Hydra vulgaris TaxID=6087 RepID=A0ABM4CKG6_HYDVU